VLRLSSVFLLLLAFAGFLSAQESSKSDPDKPRVFITDSQSWEIGGVSGGGPGGGGSRTAGGARPQTAEIIKTFGQRCPQVVTNNIQQKADYIVLLDHEGGKSFVRHKNKVAVFARVTGDSVVSKSTLSLGGSVQDACDAIKADWAIHGDELRETAAQAAAPAMAAKDPPAQPVVPVAAAAAVPATPATGKLSIASVPDGADIEVDGNFIGNAPSDVQLPEGEHTVTVKKTGFKDWQRKMKISAGSSVRLNAELEK
jgi:PEGA domain